jgi:parallel beta-helix repeat protein
MNTRATAAVLSIMLVTSLLGVLLHSDSVSANPATILVPQDYSTIQAAVNAANSGDLILVDAGTYTENVVITKSVTLLGSSQNQTIIEAPSLTAVDVKSNNVTISGFTIRGGSTGVNVLGYNSSKISNNTIGPIGFDSGFGIGIVLQSSHTNTIFSNVISLAPFGILLARSDSNLISDNVVTHISILGIGLQETKDNRISNNTITFNERGISPEDSNSTIFEGNTVMNNTIGVSISSSHGNRFYLNNFINNTAQVFTLDSENFWNATDKGNFWSDYTGQDNNSDGIGDSPYVIDAETSPVQADYFPLMTKSSAPTDITPPFTVNDYNGLWQNTDFAINLTAVDDLSGVKDTYYAIDGGQTTTLRINGQPYISTESSNHTLEYWSADNTGNEEPHHVLINVKLDKTPPTGSIQINNDDDYTTSITVLLNLSATDSLSEIAQMQFSHDGATYSAVEAYSTSKTWNLTASDGIKTVFVTYLDAANNTQTYNDTILLDIGPPILSIMSPRMGAQINSASVTVEWNGTDAGFGIDHFELTLDTNSPINVGTSQSFTLEGLSDGDHTVAIKAFDKLGQASEQSVDFIVNTTPIGGPGYLEEIVLVILVATAIALILAYFFRVRRKTPTHNSPNMTDMTQKNE